MRIRVLGSMEVRDPDPVPLGGPTQRRTLGMLLIHCGRTVSIDQLVDGIWVNGDAPDRAEQNVPKYVHRLRAMFGAHADRIQTVGAGYRLALEPDELDATRFEGLIDEARAATTDGESGRALQLLDEALALWNGRPYDDVADLDWARAEVARLSELHASAIERRFELLLGEGRHTELVGPLQEAIGDEPWRERRRAQLALALYRAGRQAEALRVLRDFRAELVDELGLDPSAELDELEHRILDQDPTLLPGSQRRHAVRGYQLGEVIGEGAFSLVWRGTQPTLGRSVAVKQIRAELANQAEFIRGFETEAQTIAALEHPHIVPLYDYWREPDSAFLVMRYIGGGSLESAVLTGPLDEGRLRRMIEQVGSALHTAHRAGVLHRDVKSANVLLDDDGNFYLSDFGIAFTGVDDELAASLSTGSPAYAAPEQLRRQDLDPRSDVYSFGITVFEAATGRLPFVDAPTQAAMVGHQLNDPVPTPSSIDPSVPTWVDDVVARATAKNPGDRFTTVDDLLAAVPPPASGRSDGGGSAWPTLIDDVVNPFKALRPFRESDAADFHGRDRLITRFVQVLERPGAAGRMLAAVGPSGSGKSSVVRSGLVPALRRGAISGSERWFVATMIPGSHPFESLEAALTRVASRPTGPLVEMMRTDARGIGRAVGQVLPDEESELVLVIDQFEELFTLADDATRTAFIDGLLTAVREPRAGLRVVVTIRADFWDRPLRHPQLAARLETAAISVSPLSPDELEAAIVEPVRRQGMHYEPGLVARIIADVGDQPGALPLLQYALTELFDRQVSGLILGEAYDEIGGLAGALAKRAEATLATTSDDEQEAARRLFCRLVTLGEGTEDTRRRVRLAELGDDSDTQAVIAAFGESRMLVFDVDPTTREPTVEISHEALLRAWPRLRTWLDDDRDGLRIHRHLTEAATGWLVAGRDPGELYRGGRLEAVEAWAAGHEGDLNAAEHDFLQASLSERQAELDAEAERFDEQVRHNRRLRTLVAAAAVIAVIAAAAGVFALGQRSRANDEAAAAEELADDAVAAAEEADAAAAEADAAAAEAELLRTEAERQALVESARFLSVAAEDAVNDDPDLAVLLAVEAARRQMTAGVDIDEPMGALFATTSTHGVALREAGVGMGFFKRTAVETEPGGDRAAIIYAGSGSPGDERLDVVDLQTGGRVTVAVDGPTSVVWHATKDELAVGDGSGVIWSADPTTGEAVEMHDTGADWVLVGSFDDRWLQYTEATGTAGTVGDGPVIVVADPDTFVPVVERPGASWALVAPDGRHVLVVGRNFAELFALPSGELVGTPYIRGADSIRAAWAPDGNSLYVMSPFVGPTSELSGVLRQISVPDLVETVQEFPGGAPQWPSAVSVSPDGSLVAIGGSAGELGVFALDGLEQLTRFAGHPAFVAAIDWSPSTDQLVALDRSDQAIGWHLRTGVLAPESTTVGSTRFPGSHVLLADGSRVVFTLDANTGSQGPVEIWDDDTSRTLVPVDPADRFALAPRNDDVAPYALGVNGGIRLFDALSGDVLTEFPGTLDTPVMFSPDGKTLLARAGSELRLAALNVDDGSERWSLPDVAGGPGGPAFHPDGDVLFVPTGPYGFDSDARGPELLVVDSATGEELASRPIQSGFGGATVSPSGRLVAVTEAGAEDRSAWITVFDVAALLEGKDAVVAQTPLASGSSPVGVAFSEDESTLFVPEETFGSGLLALAVDDGLEIRWSVDTGGLIFVPVVDDGLLWLPTPGLTDSNGVQRFDLMGIPTDIEEYTSWAATLPQRVFTEAECQRYLDGPCADVVSTPSG